ncbi:Kinesin-like protein KIF18A [Mizuhopecten yessoensis]|uniref:Kinesin-like protein KIF18A n=2 Tax=Mizuhopecten yessoensis TaxID=6573 RepID=A0A210QDD7_MIZYE|nr:Kinesin-like protein KIF18A [Mizuhopecten yessoensis]
MTLGQRKRIPSYAEVAATPTRKPADSTESSGVGNKVKVVVRIRPGNSMEQGSNSRIVVKAMNENVLVFDPKEQSSPEYGYRNRRRRRDLRKRQAKDLKFAFDFVFDQNSANHNVYEQSTKQILDGLLEGYNCSVFAYGATGAGKTHTMLGNPRQPGVIYLTMMDLYTRIAAIQHEKICDVAVSYLEVYNEQIHDLLAKGGCLPVREDARNGVAIPGLSLHTPRDADELLHMLHFGNQNRTQHPTDANAESSRSHAVFQVFVRQRDRTANVSAEVRVAKMCLVDLAGSERATVTKNCGARFREGANINRSLLALGNVINALADTKYKGHVPYRDSKLTRLLKDSLGGNCQTVMIAAVSPSSLSYEDTYNTLKYADRAKHIQAQLKKNVLNVDFHVARYGQIIQELRKEINELKGKLQSYEDGKMVSMKQLCTVPNPTVTRLKESMEDVFLSRLQICREYLDSELKSRDMKWKISRKERCLARMASFRDSQQKETKDKIQRMIHSAHERMTSFVQMKEDKGVRLAKSNHSLEGLKSAVREQSSAGGDNLASENLKLSLQNHESSLALTESQYCMKYMAKVVRSQEREISGAERLILHLLHMVKQQHCILKDHDLLTSDLDSQYHNIQTITEGREVTFADQSFSDQNSAFSLGEMLNFKSLTAAQHMCEKSSLVSSQSSLSITSQSSMTNQTMSAQSSVTSLSSNNLSSTISLSESVQSSVTSEAVSAEQDTTQGPNRVLVTRRNVQPVRVQRDQPHPDHRLLSLDKKKHRSTVDRSCVPRLLASSGLLSDEVFSDLPGHVPANSINSFVGETNCSKNVTTECRVLKGDNCVTNIKSSCVLGSVDSGVSWEGQRSQEGQRSRIDGQTIGSVPQQNEASQDLNSTFTLNQENIDQSVLSRLPVVEDVYVEHSGSRGYSTLLQPQSGNKIDSGTSRQPQSGNKVESGTSRQPHSGSVFKEAISANLQSTSTQNSAHKSSQPAPIATHTPTSSTPASANKSALLTLLNINPLNTDTSSVTKPLGCGVNSVNSSTLTKTTTVNIVSSGSEIKGSNSAVPGGNAGKSSCVRSIQFDGTCTPNKVRSYAEVASSPLSSVRVPLRQFDSNTPLATQMTPGRSRNSQDKENTPARIPKETTPNTPVLILKDCTPNRILKMSSAGNQLTRQATDNSRKEKSKQLQQMGLFSMIDRSQDDHVEVPRGTTPGYMRMTKAASGRFPSRHRRGLTEESENIIRDHPYRSKSSKSLLRQKSQSTSNLARRGWQL